MFNALNVSKEWNILQKHCIDACFDCSDPDHRIPKCPKPIDQSRIDRAKSESPDLEADVVAVVVAIMAAMAADADVVQDVGVVMTIKPTHVGSGKAMPRL
jgi:hypothetical protein